MWKGGGIFRESWKIINDDCDDVVLEILGHKENVKGLNVKFLIPSGSGNYFICKRFAGQSLLWSLELGSK